MGRLRRLSGKECCDILRKNEFIEARIQGSHIVMQKRVEGSTVTVIVPNHKELKIGTLASIVRQSNLPRSLFEE